MQPSGRGMTRKNLGLLVAAAAAVLLSGCAAPTRFVVLSGSENQTFEPLLKEFSGRSGVDVQMKYTGSVDIMLELQKGAAAYDAVWPANGLWISLGDTSRKVKLAQSIMTSPVVFGIRKSVARDLGFIGKDVHVRDILAAIEKKKLSFAMTSASQSNSGASAYLGFLYALLGNPDVLTLDDLAKPALKRDIRTLLSGINRSSGSSGWLKDLFLSSNYDAMVNYESVIIETNQALVGSGREPLYVVYPVDGIVMADSPLGYINNGDQKKEDAFRKLQAFLISADTQKKIAALGRRTGIGGVAEAFDKTVFNPEWGIDTARILSPIRLPAADVILQALTLYQTEFRKPSFTIYCLDYSGSMAGGGSDQVKAAMGLLLDSEKSREYLLQPGPDDVTVVKSVCVNNQHQIGIANLVYVDSSDQYLPPGEINAFGVNTNNYLTWDQFLMPYGISPDSLVCPSQPQIKNGSTRHYWVNANVEDRYRSYGAAQQTGIMLWGKSITQSSILRPTETIALTEIRLQTAAYAAGGVSVPGGLGGSMILAQEDTAILQYIYLKCEVVAFADSHVESLQSNVVLQDNLALFYRDKTQVKP